MRSRNRFERGSGCFACEICGRLTRAAGDNAALGLCPDCFDLAGLENHISDTYDYKTPSTIPADVVKEANRLYRKIEKKGGKPAFAHMSIIKK